LKPLLRQLLTLGIVAGMAVGGWRAWPLLKAMLPGTPEVQKRAPAAPTNILSLESVPEGATVLIGGKAVGETPLYLENVYPSEDITVTLTKPGFKPWSGTFRGGKSASVHAPLRRR
jgi:serine/threonine-protein kinase